MIIDFLNQNQVADEKIRGIMSHIARAEHNWYFRVMSQQQDIPVWGLLPLEELNSRFVTNCQLWLDAARGWDEDALAKPLAYKNMQGEPFLNSLEDVLAHVVNHSTYHRGQVILLIREAGMVPPTTDYIRFVRSLKS